MDVGEFDKALASLEDVIEKYRDCEVEKPEIKRIKPMF
jgi:hypothetical protein